MTSCDEVKILVSDCILNFGAFQEFEPPQCMPSDVLKSLVLVQVLGCGMRVRMVALHLILVTGSPCERVERGYSARTN